MQRQLIKRSTQEVIGKLTLSIGAAQYQDGDPPEAIVARADKWLYSAKHRGRNCVASELHNSDNTAFVDADRSIPGLQWSRSYESGDALIDNEHRELFSLANALFDPNLASHVDPRKRLAVLDNLLNHIRTHFRDEEAQLSANNYIGLKWHKAAHAKLLRDADELKRQVESGEKTLGDLREFVVNKLIFQHLMTVDREFFSLFKTISAAVA
jgi:hemerythrin-like metal-binding protein